jgi:hypothetical protein
MSRAPLTALRDSFCVVEHAEHVLTTWYIDHFKYDIRQRRGGQEMVDSRGECGSFTADSVDTVGKGSARPPLRSLRTAS